jgi:hypothetical protein
MLGYDKCNRFGCESIVKMVAYQPYCSQLCQQADMQDVALMKQKLKASSLALPAEVTTAVDRMKTAMAAIELVGVIEDNTADET